MSELLDSDWASDSKNNIYMTPEILYDALFELVDIWTPEAEKEQYIGFFKLLKLRLKTKKKCMLIITRIIRSL